MAMQHNKVTSSDYVHTSSLLLRLYGTNKVSVTEVLEMSWFVYKPVITYTMS